MARHIHSRSAVTKGRAVNTVEVTLGDGQHIAQVQASCGLLGYPESSRPFSTFCFQTVSAALTHQAEIVAKFIKDGWAYCENWQERSHEKMTVTSLRLASGVRAGVRAKQPELMTIAYPEPYHLAAYIKVTTFNYAAEEEASDAIKQKQEYCFDYQSALEAKRAAKSRIDAASLIGYEIIQTGGDGRPFTAVLKAAAAVKLLLDAPPAKEDWGPLVMAIEPRPMTGEVAIRFAIRTFQKSDARLRELLRKRQPLPMEAIGRGPGVFYPSAVNEETAQSQVVTVLAVGALVGGKLVGGGGAMPAMGIKSSFAEIHAKPAEPKPIRHIELE